MNKRAVRWITLGAAVWASSACGPRVKPGLKVTGSPTGAVRGDVLVLVEFDRPMVAPDQVGKEVTQAPLRVTPALPGRLEWTDPATLTLHPAERPPRATHFSVEVPAGTRALDGFGIRKSVRFEFDTERLEARAHLRGRTEYDPRWAVPDQEVALELTQPTRADEVSRRCRFLADGKRVRVAVAPQDADPRTSFFLHPNAPLALDTKWSFHCDEALHPSEGPLGLSAALEREFHTYGPFRLVKVKPEGQDVDPEGESILIELSNPPKGSPLPIQIEPKVVGFPERAYADEAIVRSSVSLEPQTSYTITIDGSLEDAFGQKLGATHKASFKTGNAKPGLSMETGQWVVESSRPGYVLWTRNLSTIEVEAAKIAEGRLLELLPQLHWWDEEAVDLGALKIPSVKQRLQVKGRQNKWDQYVLEPQKLLGGAAQPGGFYYFAVRAPETADKKGHMAAQEALINFTDLGVMAKLAPAAGLLWVTRLSSGQPVPDAQIVIRDRKGAVKWRGKTDPDGVAVTPGRAKLLPAASARKAEEAEEEFEEEREPSKGLLVFVRAGSDVTFLDPLREGGLGAYNFHVSPDHSPGLERLRGFVHTDRGLYRPGDTVHIKGLARTMRLGEGLRVPEKARARVEVRDPRGNPMLQRALGLSKFGGLSFDVALPADARLGDYAVSVTLPQGTFRQSFSVEEYRTATYEVKITPEKPRSIAGEKLRLVAEGRYFYGSPVRGAKLNWRIHSRPRTASFAGFPDYEFDDQRVWEPLYERSSHAEDLVTEGEGKLDRDGRASFSLDLGKSDIKENVDYLVEAQVQDETHQTISAHLAVPIHRAAISIGIATGEPVVEAKKLQKARLLAVDPEGKRVPAQVKLQVLRQQWHCAWEEWGYRGTYRCEDKKIPILEQRVSLFATGAPAEVSFTPPQAGEYWIVAEAKDSRGRATAAARNLWVWGGGEAAWRASDALTFDILPDKSSYKPGETAHVLLKTPFARATGLVTIEREGVLERRLFQLEPGKQSLEVPIKDGYGPNVYVSVVLVKGRTGPGGRGMPLLRMGLANLPVAVEARRLKVSVSTERERYRPGETVKAQVRVTDGAGKPVAAEVSLSAADEGVLSLIGFRTPDPVATFYAPWGLGVHTTTEYDRLAQLPEPGQERLATGGDSSARLGTLRSRFLSTAYWSPALETDADGRVQVSFPAPDNLTAFRLMAVAADGGERFGSGERRFTVSKPLQLLTALPRFFTVGDQARGGVVVHNDTGQAGTARVEANVVGLELTDGFRRDVQVPAGGRVPVHFPMHASKAGPAKLRFAVTMGGEHDGLEVTLPVVHPSSVETELLAEGVARDPVSIPIKLPKGALVETGSVEISVDPDGLAGIEEGLRALVEYPYGCLEQTTSRVIPLVMVEELSRQLALEGLDGPALQRFLAIGIEKIGRHQTFEGGYSLWPGGRAEPYLTAYALWGLYLAKRAGHPVDPHRIDDGVAYLRRALGQNVKSGDVHNELGELGGRAFALHVLALLGQPEPQLAVKLRAERAKLPRFGQAFLARALGASLGKGDPAVGELVGELEADAELTDGQALVREPGGRSLWWYMSDDTRTSAIVLDALDELRPQSPLVPKLVKGLLKARRGGSWATTQDNLYALVALTHYAQAQRHAGVRAGVALGEKAIGAVALTGGAPRVKHLRVPLAQALAAGGQLTLKPDGGKVYYSVRLRFRRDEKSQTERSAGLTLRHEYLDQKTGKPVGKIKVGDVVRVRVTVATPDSRNHLALSDRLPAGFEAINTRLKTVSGASHHEETGNERESDAFRASTYQELRDDRVQFYAEYLDKGVEVIEYLARATTAGTYVVPSAIAEEMYRPETHARTALRTLEVGE